MTNFPGPHQFRFFYAVTLDGLVRNHQQNLNCEVVGDDTPGQPMTDYMVARRGLGDEQANVCISNWAELLQAAYGNTMTLNRAELWRYDAGTNNAAFMSTTSLAMVGESIAANVPDGEVIHTYRTIGGGSLRLHFMETAHAAGLSDSSPFTNVAHEAIRAFVVGTGNFILARDNTYPFAAMSLHPGINERLFKDRYRA